MGAPQMYQQCEVSRGNVRMYAWLPSDFARVGDIIDLREHWGWSKGWTVSATYGRLSEEYVREHERDYKTQRQASDI